MSRAPAVGLQEIAELRAALQPLDAAVPDTCWNHAELDGLPIPATGLADAAVLVGLVPHAAGTTVLLTRRTDALRNHAGQVSFPGGRVEPDDADAIAAALRETGEEIGVPVHQISPIGLLDPLMTITGFRVLPVVAMIDRDYVAVPDPGEVAEVFEVPLAFLVDPANLGHHHVEFGGRRRRVLEFRYPAQRIWGVTASILWNLRKRLEETR